MATSGSLYSAAYDFPRYPSEPRSSIMLAATPRSGSTFLGIELWRTGRFGSPLEYLNLARRVDMLPRLGNGDCIKYWREVKKVRTSSNGIFSFKAFVSDLHQVSLRCMDLLSDISSDYVIYLERRDKIGQTISFAKAMQTSQWYSIAKPARPAFYDTEYLDKLYQQLRSHEESWERLFFKTDSEPLRIFYEDLIADKEETIRKIFEFCDIPFEGYAAVDLPELSIQRDEESEKWRSTYLAEKIRKEFSMKADRSDHLL